MTIDAVHLPDARHSIVVLRGRSVPGCAPPLREVLRTAERQHTGHVIVDVRLLEATTHELAKVLLWSVGRALDRGRTLRLVVRDEHQARRLGSLGLRGMTPMHRSLAEATEAVDAVYRIGVRRPQRTRTTTR